MIARSRVVAAVLAVLLVTVAAIAYRISDPDTDSDLVRAPLEQSTPFLTGQVVVSDVRIGSSISTGDDRYVTQGLFVVVNLAVRASGRDRVSVPSSQLLTRDGVTYLPGSSLGQIVTAEPGFETSRDLFYEVDPTRIDDLTLELWNQGLTYRYYERTQTPLGITAANARQWAEAGAGHTVVVPRDAVTRALT